MQESKTPVYQILDTNDIIPTPENPRIVSPKQLSVIELSASILKSPDKMVYEPILVRVHPTEKGMYDLRDGERRLCASILAGVDKIPVMLHDWTDEEAFEVTVLLNLQRENLTPMEESRACKYLLEKGDDLETAAARLGKSVDWVKRRAYLTRIIDSIQEKIAVDDLFSTWGMGHLEVIAKLDPESQQKLLDGLDDAYNFPHTLNDLKEYLHDDLYYLDDAGFDLDKEIAGKIACMDCPKRSSCTPELPGFEDDKNSDKVMCFDPECYEVKGLAAFGEKLQPMKDKYPNLILMHGEGHDYEFREKYKIQYKHQYSKCKKSDTGAIPCLTVNLSTKALAKQVHWQTKDQEPSFGNEKPKKKADEMTLKEKRKGLEKKRIKHSLIQLNANLEDFHYAETDFLDDVTKLENLICLVAAILDNHYGKDVFEDFEAIKKEGNGIKMLTNWIQEQLSNGIDLFCTLDRVEDDKAKKILSLMKDGDKKWLAYMDDATNKIKEPKSWTAKEKAKKKK